MKECIEYIKNYLSSYFSDDKNKSLKIANSIYLIRRLIKMNSHNKELNEELYKILRELKN